MELVDHAIERLQQSINNLDNLANLQDENRNDVDEEALKTLLNSFQSTLYNSVGESMANNNLGKVYHSLLFLNIGFFVNVFFKYLLSRVIQTWS